MKLAERYMAEVADVYETYSGHLELLPLVLAKACAKVLPIAGAGISMTIDELRVPLGASDDQAARAERLQTTLGEGPCLGALEAMEPSVFDLPTIAGRWPVFYAEVMAETNYRSIASVPLRSPDLPRYGALDLYSTEPDASFFDCVGEISADIGDQIGALLFEAPTAAFEQGVTLPIWLSSGSVTDRMDVWVAVGMLIEEVDLSNEDALAALRAYAFGHDATLDEVAHQVTTHQIKAEALLSGA